MKVLPKWQDLIDEVAARLTGPIAKERYQSVSVQTSIPWFVIAVVHERESSQSWSANLANGDPWDRPTIHVPKGRGPFSSWESAAVDSLKHCAPHPWIDWSSGGALTYLEAYNGFGYASRDVPSPYVWSATDQYIKGKYVADGHYDPNVQDHQIGCAGLIFRMSIIDQSVHFDD